MAKTYDNWMDVAREQRRNLDAAISINNSNKIIYYRGKYLYALKQAYKLNPTGIVPQNVSNSHAPSHLVDEIRNTFSAHSAFIDSELVRNKANSDILNNTLYQELGLKLKRLSTRASEVSFASNDAEKRNANQNVGRSFLGLLGTMVKAPFMITSKVASKVGPLAVKIVFLPAKLLSTLFTTSLHTVFEINDQKGPYDHKVIDTVSNGLGSAVKKVFEASYKGLGRL